MKPFTVISTFSGCGGSSLGYEIAGGKVLLAVEYDDNAVQTYRLNFPDTPIYHGDIAALSVEECCHLAGVRPGDIDILDGSPPCQGFSVNGKREIGDARNKLFQEFCRLLKGLQPRCFVMENVAGLVRGVMKLVFADIFEALEACGYRVGCRLLNAQYFGVPQSRERLIFVGVRHDLGAEPSFPKATALRPVTVRQAFRGIHEPPDALPITPLYRKYWHSAGEGGVMGKLKQERRLAWDRTSFTLLKDSVGPYHPGECRAISSAERKRLSTFPDSFKFLSRRSAMNRIGNAVPPLLMKAIAENIRDELLPNVVKQSILESDCPRPAA